MANNMTSEQWTSEQWAEYRREKQQWAEQVQRGKRVRTEGHVYVVGAITYRFRIAAPHFRLIDEATGRDMGWYSHEICSAVTPPARKLT